MTGKRFNIKPSAIVDDVTVIIDNQKEYTFPVLDSTLNYMFYKVLNEQHETIQRLKENIDELMQLDVEEELLKENEQLKQRIEDYNKALKTLQDVYERKDRQLQRAKKDIRKYTDYFMNELNWDCDRIIEEVFR